MSQYKAMLVYTDEEGYQSALRIAKEKVTLFNKALGVASTHIAVEDTKAFAESFTTYFKREFYKKHKEKIQLDISVEKLLGLLDINLKPLYDLEVQFHSINAEIRWEENKPTVYVDKKPYERWTKSAKENEIVKAGRKLLDAIDEISNYTNIYPLTIQQATSNLIAYNMRTNEYRINLL